MAVALVVACAVVVVVFVVVPAIALRMRGYRIGGRMIVRCRQGHLFTTVWVPGVSFKAVRLGWWRFQHCPVGDHWTLVSPVRESDLTEDQQRAAREVADVSLP